MKRVYIAGKYNDTDIISVLRNIREGIEAAVDVLNNGDIPFCPFIDFLFALVNGGESLTEAQFKAYSMEWLRVCDEILLLPSWERSNGSKSELEEAVRLGIEVRFL